MNRLLTRAAPIEHAARRSLSGAEWAALLAAVLIAAWLRLPDLDRLPVGMSQDEVIRGYDAWCVWRTGRDHRNVWMPAFTECFGPGDFPAAPTVYLTAPLVGMFGLSPAMVRLPIALLGVLTIPLLWWWVRREFGPVAGAAAAWSLAVSPWHALLTRFAFEAGATPFLVTLGLGWLVRRGGSGTRFAGGIAGLMLGIALWIYPSPRAVLPLLLVGWLLTRWLATGGGPNAQAPSPLKGEGWGEGDSATDAASVSRQYNHGALPAPPTADAPSSASAGIDRRASACFAIALLIGASPLIATLITQPARTLARARQLGMQQKGDTLGAAAQFARQYVAHYNPVNLFWPGEPRTAMFKSDYKTVQPIEGPLLIVGVLWLWRRRRTSRPAAFMLFWLALYPLPAALARDVAPHEIRSLMGLPLLSIISGLGAARVIEWAARFGRAAQRGVAVAALAAALFSAYAYRGSYRGPLQPRIATFMQADLLPAFEWLREHGGPFDAGFVAFPTNQGYCFYLFGMRVDPAVAQAAPVRREPWALGFEYVGRFGPFYFAPPPQLGPPWDDEAIRAALRGLPAGARAIVLSRPGQISIGRTLRVIEGINGTAGTKATLGIEIREALAP